MASLESAPYPLESSAQAHCSQIYQEISVLVRFGQVPECEHPWRDCSCSAGTGCFVGLFFFFPFHLLPLAEAMETEREESFSA